MVCARTLEGSRGAAAVGPVSDVAYFTPMRRDVRVEPIAGSFVGNAGDLGQFVGFIEALARVLFERVNRVPKDAQVSPHALFQHHMGLAL